MTQLQFVGLAYCVSFTVLICLCLWLGFSYRRLRQRLSRLEARLAAAQKRQKRKSAA